MIVASSGMLSSAQGATPPKVEYNRDIRPILSDKCFRCHGPDGAQRQADLRLDRREDAVTEQGESGAIVPGKPDESEVVRRIVSTDADERMPPRDSGQELSQAEIDLIRTWIGQGAEYQPHWSFLPPKAAKLPKVSDKKWPRNAIDRFVLAELDERGVRPSPEANKATLLRRVSLDLTGLPPTLAELDAFLADDSPQAYERVVDRLLASPSYGERMALDWLDAARYADTNGYYTDVERQAWPWRDWVIAAFNANKPFDEFTIEQLAGDLLPEATVQQKVATGFNRNHMVTNESGVDDEEYRVGYVVDRVDTTTTVWMGLTVGCARCHDHKYDPISQREYYQLFAYFNNIQENGLVKDPTNPPPVMGLPTPEQERQLAKLADERKVCEAKLRGIRPPLSKQLADWEPSALSALSATATEGMRAHFALNGDGGDRGPAKLSSNVEGTLPFTPGVRGQAADFNGDQYIESPGGLSLDRDKPFSLSVWIKPGNGPQGCVVSKMDGTAASRGFEIMWYKSQPRINIVHEWARNAIEVVARQSFSRQWHHLAIVYDGSSKAAGLSIFVDGKQTELNVKRDTLTGSIATDDPWRIAWKATGIGFEGGIDELRLYDRTLTSDEVDALYWTDLLAGAIETPPADRQRHQTDALQQYYITRFGSDELRNVSSEIARLKEEEAATKKTIVSSPVMHERDEMRSTHLLLRGQFDQPGDVVSAGLPAALSTNASNGPPNRLGLAQWLVSDNNPLTARVIVNRYWQLVFGEGIVRTANDFGLQGELPTHPELLDWLAVEFRESGWDVKRLMKLLVMSATYRQLSNFTPELLAADPENRLLARGPRYRLPAELIRDQALALSGLLVERVGGPSVKPYQPPGLWEAVSYNGDMTYVPDAGESLYRRGLYTFWKRQVPPPGLLAFDGPTREVCTVRRARTNTPLQALVLLNDVTYIEAARVLAQKILREEASDGRVQKAFRTVTGREPSEKEVSALNELYAKQLAEYRADRKAAEALLKQGESKIDPKLDPCELAAWTIVASVLLNLDEVITQH
jgi:hypothetical protein